MIIVYRDNIGTVTQECKGVYFGHSVDGKKVLIEVDENKDFYINVNSIIQILKIEV